MNVLVLDNENAQKIIAAQSGQNQLAPVELSDGRFFLPSNVLTEEHFACHFVDVVYETVDFDSIKNLIPSGELDY